MSMSYEDASHRMAHEQQVKLLARIIEVRGGDDDGYADRVLKAIITQAKPRDKAIAVKLAADVDAWRRARRAYRNFFE
jgi:hypothetical protein